jgi:hypothetical protein
MHEPQHTLQGLADALPALGIVAAVLGVVKTMGSIDQAPFGAGWDDRIGAGRHFHGRAAGLWHCRADGRAAEAGDRSRRADLPRGQAGHHRQSPRLAAAAGGRKRALRPGPRFPPRPVGTARQHCGVANPWPHRPVRAARTKPPPPIIVKKITVVAAGHHGGAWKVAYADFVTAMMAFFLLLWLLGATTEKQRKGWPIYFTPDPGQAEAGKRRLQRHAGRHHRSPMSTIIPTAPARPATRR